ncbi:protein NDUFAF4 homolog [Harmonia axyridis]|uniref:protein NDUFAF4 homolog n=1 Tax=Harmonia axyridis TaxID=115357 RepID=UPI001E279D67|nr:protein NDUFAF4 homolog [Harmonia axyridis]
MGKILSHMKRPFQNYNIESRAHKIISQNKPIPAPHREMEQMEIDQILKENSPNFQESLRKHEELDKNLKKVFVTSKSTIANDGQPKRPLPSNRNSYIEPTLGIIESVQVPKGKVSLLNALKFITNHHNDASRCTVDQIVTEYSLPKATVRNILRYCRSFEIYMPEDKKTKAKFAGPHVQRIKVTTMPLKQLTPGDVKGLEKKSDKK